MTASQNAKPANAFREAAVRQLSSPRHLDRYLSVASPANWLILVAVLLMFGATAAWSWKGAVTKTATGRGILVGSGGLVSVNAVSSGQVVEVMVKPGESVRAHQVIARIGNPLLTEQVRLAEMALAEACREADRNVGLRGETARIQIQAQEAQWRNLETEISELEHQTVFATEQASNQQKLFDEGLTIKSTLIAAQEKLSAIRADIARHHSQIEQLQSERFAAQAGVAHADAASQEHVAGLVRSLAALREELRQTTSVTSAYGGRVIESRIYPGATVTPGAPLVTIQPSEDVLQAILYIPSKQAKYVVPGMEAQLSPSNTRPEEQGYLRATVDTVSPFPVSPLAITRRLENEALTTAMTSEGPVTEVHLTLRRDAESPGGYEWSSRQGGRIALSGGTLCTARIVVGQQRPLTLAVPALKEAFGVN